MEKVRDYAYHVKSVCFKKRCPICRKLAVRIDKHLRQIHHVKRTSEVSHILNVYESLGKILRVAWLKLTSSNMSTKRWKVHVMEQNAWLCHMKFLAKQKKKYRYFEFSLNSNEKLILPQYKMFDNYWKRVFLTSIWQPEIDNPHLTNSDDANFTWEEYLITIYSEISWHCELSLLAFLWPGGVFCFPELLNFCIKFYQNGAARKIFDQFSDYVFTTFKFLICMTFAEST